MGYRLRRLLAVLALGIAVAGLPCASTLAAPVPQVPPPSVDASAAVLMDAQSGQVLYARNPRLRLLPASLTKIMTFELALEALAGHRITPTTQVTVSQAAWQLSLNANVSHMFLLVGEKVPVADLLYGLMVTSGNDAAQVLAETLAGSANAFVTEMNDRAAALGLRDTHYVDPHGLATSGTYTTALDVARLIRYIWSAHPDALRYTGRPQFTWDGHPQYNWNELISGTNAVTPDPRVNGFKTGHLTEAGYHLAATAAVGRQRLIAVVLGAKSLRARAVQAENLLNWGFSEWTSVHVDWRPSAPAELPVYQGAAASVPLEPAQPLWFAVPRGLASSVRVTASVTRPIVAPIKQGEQLGLLTLTAGGQPLARIPLTAARAVGSGSLLRVLWDGLRLALGRLWAHLRATL